LAIAVNTSLPRKVIFARGEFDVNAVENKSGANFRPSVYWRLWLFDAVLVSAGVLFYLATHYGTDEFYGKALAMAALPFIAAMVLVGGAGSTIFALTKVLIVKRALNFFTSLVLLVGPAVMVTLLLVLLGLRNTPQHRLEYVCAGNAPTSASQVQVVGYTTFLRAEWLAEFNVGAKDFQTMIARTELVPVDDFEFENVFNQSALKKSRLYRNLPPFGNEVFYQRVFKAGEEHKLGSIYAVYDSATSTAIVLREYQD
jgi:hypothetical protein